MEMPQTHCYATGTVTLLWKCHKLVVMQQALSRYYGNATGCTDHVTKENLICHNIILIHLPVSSVHPHHQEGYVQFQALSCRFSRSCTLPRLLTARRFCNQMLTLELRDVI